MNFARFFFLFTCLLIAPLSIATAADQAKKPNILFVLCDDLRPDAVGCLGSEHVKTPRIDQIAKEGIVFNNSFCTTSLCSPSRASILTGLYAHAHGVTDNFTEFPTEMATFPKRLQDAGYETAYIGKYHMGEDNDQPRPGFDWFVTHKGQGKYFDTAFNINGQGEKVIEGYYTHVVTDMAIDWLEKDHADKPWCLMIGQKAPHSFYFPEPKYEHAFDDVEVKYPATAFDLDDNPKWMKKRLYTWHGIYGPLFDWRKDFPDDSPEGVKAFENMVHAYWGTVLSIDDSMGRLYDWLDKSGQLDNTVIVFMGDNGLLEGEHGMVDKRTAHEMSIRVPLIVRYPKLGQGKALDQQVLTVDMAPTLIELAGAKPIEDIHGQSWAKLAAGGDDDWRKSWLYYYNYEKQFPYTPNVRALRTDRWKFIRYPHGDGSPDRHMAELYDLKADPEEGTNLAEKPEHAKLVKQLRQELTEQMESVGLTAATDKMPIDQGIGSELPDEKIR
ncbi:Arylsulfatase [Bremerella volcania]|uniref:Arylsulfatase n=1 Tax=Bremerella volcania TaxID=2527984 RepID=A0A518C921_9BACT|nr:sulfatase [Bremerella volcania]QDU75719.1 Arylsulfatase [Bremerella volcania]